MWALFPQSKNIQVMLNGDFKLPVGVNVNSYRMTTCVVIADGWINC